MRSRVVLLALIFIFIPSVVHAHPGRTASDGCHYCRTNCDNWGVGWNVRHCHNGYVAPVNTAPTSTPKPTATPKLIYTPVPTSAATSTNTPTVAPQVLGETSQTTNTPYPVENSEVNGASTSNDNGSGMIGLLFFGGVGYWVYRKIKNKKSVTPQA